VIKEQISALESLQEIDLKLERLKNATLETTKHLESVQLEMKQAKIQADRVVEEQRKDEQVERETRGQLDLNGVTLEKSKQKEVSIENQFQLDSLKKELDHLEQENTALRARLEAIAERKKARDSSLSALQENLALAQGRVQAAEQNLENAKKNAEREARESSQSRTQFAQKVEARILKHYDRVRGAKAGVGFAIAMSGRCLGCNMTIPPQLFNEMLQFKAISTCPSCHRVLGPR
jgi:predicted  nucleic acid-binding Zn-ribbon protein